MAFSQADKVQNPILEVLEPIWNSSASDAQKAMAAVHVSGARQMILVENPGADRVGEIGNQLLAKLEGLGLDSLLISQTDAAFERFASKQALTIGGR